MMSLRIPLLSVMALAFFISSCCDSDNVTWRVSVGSKKAQHYSALTEIDSSNVNKLQVAWEYHTHDADTQGHSQIQGSPIVIDSILYGTTPRLKLFAVNAVTGKEKWVFNPAGNTNSTPMNFGMNNCRGVTYWEGSNDRRILYCAGSY